LSFVDIAWGARSVRIEHDRVAPERSGAPLIVFLHEGLGSLAMWKDFPEQLCDAAGCRGLVYSRPGYGRSTPRPAEESWDLDFMHRQAHEVLPALLEALRIDTRTCKPWLFGHSDGGSIALLHAARFHERVAGAVAVAPHIVVEDLSIDSIAKAREAYMSTDLKQRLARYHDDPDSAFWGWNDIWLHPPFREWSIEAEIESDPLPAACGAGRRRQYGTLEQIRGIARRVPHTELPSWRNAAIAAPRPARAADRGHHRFHSTTRWRQSDDVLPTGPRDRALLLRDRPVQQALAWRSARLTAEDHR
jgi:pimeloyl-ACP methyl ester carboxylesterase